MAESSITIADVEYVIDFCLTKMLMADAETNFVALKLQWADKNSLDQRKGRAGRVRWVQYYITSLEAILVVHQQVSVRHSLR
jgi:ATP-dependent RNA helicase TDRD9